MILYEVTEQEMDRQLEGVPLLATRIKNVLNVRLHGYPWETDRADTLLKEVLELDLPDDATREQCISVLNFLAEVEINFGIFADEPTPGQKRAFLKRHPELLESYEHYLSEELGRYATPDRTYDKLTSRMCLDAALTDLADIIAACRNATDPRPEGSDPSEFGEGYGQAPIFTIID